MIEINLLPGSGKNKSSRMGMPAALSDAFSGISGQIRDPYMIAAVVSAVLCIAAVGGLFLMQQKREGALREAERVAVQDSATYSGVILEKRRATAKRDSVMRQVRLIQAIDDDRYMWPHLLAEVSKATPQNTWLVEVNFLTAALSPAAPAPLDSAALRAATTREDSVAILTPKTNPSGSRNPLRFAIKGNTVDVQAMTRFMEEMEQSPFIQNVQLKGSKAKVEQNVTLNEFVLEAEFQVPDSVFVRRAPIKGSVR